MKRVLICGPDADLEITMPSFMVWLFRKYAKCKFIKLPKGFRGNSSSYVVMDEFPKEKKNK